MSAISKVMQKITMSSPSRAKWFMTSMKPGFFIKKGRSSAIEVYKFSVKKVKAYNEFLKANNIEPTSISNFADFEKLPFTDKTNYISKYPLDERIHEAD